MPTIGARQRAFILTSLAVLMAGYGWIATRMYLAARYGTMTQASSLERALQYEPGNAENHFRLGWVLLYGEQEVSGSLSQFQAAVSLNPREARYWLALADAFSVNDQPANQMQAIEHALIAAPRNPAVAWTAAILILMHGDVPRALRLLRVVVENDPTRQTSVFDLCLRAGIPLATVTAEVLPPSVLAHNAMLQFLMERRDFAGTKLVWDKMMGLNVPFDQAWGLYYIDFLLANNRFAEANHVWRDVVRIHPNLNEYVSDPDPIVNGSFELPLLHGGFDWSIAAQPHVSATIDSTVFHQGLRSLSLAFDGSPISDAGVGQFVAVQPSTSYAFHVFTRTKELETANAPRFAIFDAYDHQTIYGMTAEVPESTAWERHEIRFTTNTRTSIVELRLVRTPASTGIRGQLWVDDAAMNAEK
jgi:tetratricopeptide (TPR) repeat protein